MKHKFLTMLLVLAFCLTSHAQFRRTSDGAIYPYTTTLSNSDVFIIGVVGVTNKNVAWSNIVSSIGAGVTPTNTTQPPGVVTSGGRGIGTNTIPFVLSTSLGTAAYSNSISFQSASLILSNVVSGGSNRYVGSFIGNGAGLTNVPGSGSSTASTNEIFSYVLSNSTAIGDSNIKLDRPAAFTRGSAGRVFVDWGSTNVEIRAVNSGTNEVVTFNVPLAISHAAGAKVLWVDASESFPSAANIIPASSTDSGWPMLQLLEESAQTALFINGSGQAISTRLPFVVPNSTRVRNVRWNAITGYPLGNTNIYMYMGRQGARNAFTASSATDIITIPSGWTPPASPSNATVVFYDLGAGTMPQPLSNGVPYYVVASTPTTVTVKNNIAESSAINLTTDGSGVMASEAGSLVKQYLEDVYMDGGIQPDINGLWANVQQQSYFHDLRIANFKTGLRLTGQQADFLNTEIGPCEVGIDMRAGILDNNGALFMFFKTLNIEAFTRNAIILGGAANHIIDFHIEGGTSTTEPIIEGSLASNDIVVDGITVGSMSGTNDIFRMGTAALKTSYDIRNLTATAATSDNGMLALNDGYRGHRIEIYNTTNINEGTSTRQIRWLLAPAIPDSAGAPSKFGGATFLGQGGAYLTLPQQQTWENFAEVKIGTNQTGAAFRVIKSNGTEGSGFGTNGNLIAPAVIVWTTPTNPITLSYPYTASTIVLTNDVYVNGVLGLDGAFPSAATFGGTNSQATNITVRFAPSFISQGGQITNNALVVPPAKKFKAGIDFDGGTNVAASIQP